ncbi:SoxR reducing system RseC family protein [Oceanispirochaeta sp.]|uniref:SoxR reducing system RseC family protein n=1 Tax=Oceanispirochaeta sp. TaxID=2035350 RepID=UPI00262EC461|nr:SoxR reducing system RseC family protein [Oceanispirochaeta sp.]MDA3955872.1 SoxR reducing system RseC family protein [Oceanispirochaeta sp.]
MSKYARILEIKDNRVILGLLNDTGLCGSGKCEGCSCSTKIQTMKLSLPENSPLTTGMDVEMIAPKSLKADWFLLIVLPVFFIVLISLLPGFTDWQVDEQSRNLFALGGGILGFAGSALLLKLLRKNQTIELVALSRDDQV